MDVIDLPLGQIIPYARNPRRNEKAIATVAASIAEFGWRQPIVVDEAMVVLAGHTRLAAAQQLGLETAPVHIAKGLTPLTTALMVAARNDDVVTTLAEEASDEERALVFAKAIARMAILEWEGVGDVDGHTIPVSPEGINALLDIYPVFEAFQLRYVSKGLLMDAEKKSLRPC
jgi:ParB/Sulfiredoxin domain